MTLLFFILISFTQLRKEEIQTPKAQPLLVSTRMMNISGSTFCDQVFSDTQRDNFNDPSLHDLLCWSNNGNATFSYTFKGVQFLIYGKQRQFGKFNLLLDGEDLGEIIEASSNKNVTDLLYTSRVYKYGYHTITAEGQKGQYFEIFKFAFWPDFKVKRLNITNLCTSVKYTEIGERYECIARLTFKIKTSKIWIYGTIDPNYGILRIQLNTHNYLIETNGPREDCKLLFESEKMNFTYNTLSFILEHEQFVSVCCIYYIYDQLIPKDFNSSVSSNNGKLVALMTSSIFENTHIILIKLIIFIVTIAILVINIKKLLLQENTFIIVINGDNTSKLFSSYALLIKRLAIKYLGIEKDHILIFEKGGDNNSTPIIPEKRVFIQLTENEVYETKPLDFEFDFIPFHYTNNILYSIHSFFQRSNCKEPNIILYMYDNAFETSFGLNFLELYLGLMEVPHSSLFVYNDGYKNNSMITKIKNYFVITQVIDSFTPKIKQDELFYIASIASHLYPSGNFAQLDKIYSLDNRYFNYISKNGSYDSFGYILSYLKGESSKDQVHNKFIYEFSKKDTDLLILFVDFYEKQYSIPYKYDTIHSIFEKGIRVIQEILIKLNITNAEFWKIICELKSDIPNFAERIYKVHKNHFIINCSHENIYSQSFLTRQKNENKKFIADSPVMSAYIIESLMNRSIGKNSVNDIKKRVYRNHNGFIIGYSTQSIQFKKWVGINIDYWKTDSNFETKNLLNQNINMKTSVKDIMELVDFKLAMKCDVQFDEKNGCPNIKTQNSIGIRLVDLNQEYAYGESFNEMDDYYDSLPSDINGDSNTLNNLEEAIPNYSQNFPSYDMIIPQSYINEVIHEINMKERISYPLRVIIIFKHELNKLINNEKFIKKYASAKSNELIICEVENLMYDWIKHFCPTYIFEEELGNFIQYYVNFVSQYRIPKDDAHDIFYNYMNVADQVASQLSHNDNKAAYNNKRLKFDSQKDIKNYENI